MLEPSRAERARTLIEHAASAVLATLFSDYLPFVTPVPMMADGAGNPVMVLTNLEPHVQHAWLDGKAGLTCGDRLTIQGTLEDVPGLEQVDLQGRYLRLHPDAHRRVESLDCAWLRLRVTNVRMDDEWLAVADYANAEPDPLVVGAGDLVRQLNEDLQEDCVLLAQAVGGRLRATAAEFVGLDRYGLDVLVTEPKGRSLARVPFTERVDTSAKVIPAVAYMVRYARDRASAAV